eukprot:855490-Prymnesium_polylepis.1
MGMRVSLSCLSPRADGATAEARQQQLRCNPRAVHITARPTHICPALRFFPLTHTSSCHETWVFGHVWVRINLAEPSNPRRDSQEWKKCQLLRHSASLERASAC